MSEVLIRAGCESCSGGFEAALALKVACNYSTCNVYGAHVGVKETEKTESDL